ncbi:phospholipid carrier-dependent glycosyltransferase [Sphingomonadaceae bacterium LXI357]|uniref:Polyprenol-phosphate-mannose--protein mannosyltransferase n=2 Tax=Stakelama marina TaxID=2826939 RepID=A0A8T4II13_9SPHN|nr:phospholipid carrier-dependent glycosyltransferase [Stakelama marina]
MLDRLRQRPLWVAVIIAVFAQALFSYRLGSPDKVMFDEVYYVPAARALLALNQPFNKEHPLLAKEFIALGMALFGDNPIGWRAFSTLAGTATILGGFSVLWQLFGRMRTAVFGAVLLIFSQTVFVQARIAMLDTYMAAFLTLAIAAMLWSMAAPTTARAHWRLVLTAVLLGLATAAKWAAAPYVAFAFIAFVAIRLRDARASGRPIVAALSGRNQRHWPGVGALSAMLILGLVSILVYFATYAPQFFYRYDPLTLSQLIPFQEQMYAAQTQVLRHHPYQSPWWSWSLDLRPIWYLYEINAGAWRGVLLLGNPAAMWGGLAALAACLYAGLRDRAMRPLGLALIWIASLAMWAVIPKSLGFYYYYYPSSIFLCLATAGAFAHFGRGRWAQADEWYAIPVIALFVYFYPILSASPLSGRMAFAHWTWLASWR